MPAPALSERDLTCSALCRRIAVDAGAPNNLGSRYQKAELSPAEFARASSFDSRSVASELEIALTHG